MDSSATLILTQILGAIVLLLWGIRLVRTGIMRVYGSVLRNKIGTIVDNKASAFGIGVIVTALIQSSTATALIVSSFAAKGLLATGPALAVMLGADVGTTIVAQLLTFQIDWLSPVLLVTGYLLHSRGSSNKPQQIGRSLFGLGLVLLSLTLVKAASTPMRESETLIIVLTALENEILLALLVAALITWLSHSSLAIVLFISTLASVGAISIHMAFVLVVGANLGGTIAPLVATARSGVIGLRVTAGNAIFKLLGAIVIIGIIPVLIPLIERISVDPIRMVVNFHMFFNIGVALVFVWFTGFAARQLNDVLPSQPVTNDASAPVHLETSLISIPHLALGGATREILRLGAYIEEVFVDIKSSLVSNDISALEQVKENCKRISNLQIHIKRYITKVMAQELSEEESNQATHVFSAAINLGHIADISENVAEITQSRIRKQLQFSEEGAAELLDICTQVESNLKVALLAFMREDEGLTKNIKKSRKLVNQLGGTSAESHIDRIRLGQTSSIQTSELHLELLRDLSRINDHIVLVAKPVH